MFAAALLLTWTGFLLLNALQPCCEVLAGSLSHRHGQESSTAVARHTEAHAVGHPGGGVDEHDHCATSDGIDTSLPDFLTPSSIEADIQYLFVGLVLLVLYSVSPTLRARTPDDHERGPPGRVYLTTLRLRI